MIGSGIGGLPAITAPHEVLLERGPGRVSPFFIPSQIVNMAALPLMAVVFLAAVALARHQAREAAAAGSG